MACDAASVQLLSAVDGLSKISHRGLLAILANLYSLAISPVPTAAQAQATAMAAGYAEFNDYELWQCFLSSICTGSCNATTLAAINEANGYEKLSERALLEGMVAVACMANCNATALVASAVANGYERLSERGLIEALVANACKTGCTAKTLYATAIANGYDKFSHRDIWKSIITAICVMGGPAPPGFLFPIPTGFSVNSNLHGTVLNAGWFLPAPAGVTGAEVWTSTDGINYTRFSTVAPPTANQTFAALTVGNFQWTKIRWTNGAGGFSDFTSPIEWSGQAMDWAQRIVTNGDQIPTTGELLAVNNMWCDLVNGGISSHVLSLYPLVGNGSITSMVTPLIRGAGTDPGTNHNFVNASATVNGLVGNASAGIFTNWIPTSFASDNNAGVSVYCITGTNDGTNYTWGGYDGANGIMSLHVNDAGSSLFDCFSLANRSTVASPAAGGFYSVNRVAAADLRLFFGNSTNAMAQVGATNVAAGSARSTINLCIGGLATNNVGAGTLFNNQTESFWCAHDGLTLAQATTMFNAVQKMRVALGGGFV